MLIGNRLWHSGVIHWDMHNAFSSWSTILLFINMIRHLQYSIMSLPQSTPITIADSGLVVIFIPYHSASVITWLIHLIKLVNNLIQSCPLFKKVIFEFHMCLPIPLIPQYAACLYNLTPDCIQYCYITQKIMGTVCLLNVFAYRYFKNCWLILIGMRSKINTLIVVMVNISIMSATMSLLLPQFSYQPIF